MTVPATALPSLSHLVRMLRAPRSDGSGWLGSRRDAAATIYYSGSVALAAGIEAVRAASGTPSVTLWVPAYFCDGALRTLRDLPITLRFYPIAGDLTPAWDALAAAIPEAAEPHVLLLVHYFGLPNAGALARSFADRHHLVLFEDGAHLLDGDVPGVGHGDLMIFSPHKLMALPSGGVLVLPRSMAGGLSLPADSPPMRHVIRWFGRRLAQKLLASLQIPWHRWLWPTQAPIPQLAPLPIASNCDPLTLKLLTVMADEARQFVKQRRHNYLRLTQWLRPVPSLTLLAPVLPEGACPYALPLLVESGAEDVVAELLADGIPASRWPDLPPEVTAAPERYPVALETYRRMVLLPVHQGLSSRQIDLMGRQVRRLLESKA